MLFRLNIFLSILLPVGAFLDQIDEIAFFKNKTVSQLWDYFLTVQSDLYFPHDAKWIEQQSFWKSASAVLEMGCGNGTYLAALSKLDSSKEYCGLEISDDVLENAQNIHAGSDLQFFQGDAQVYDSKFEDRYDIVVLRLVLLHVKDPLLVVESAKRYLKEGGHIIIIDNYHRATLSSHPLSGLENAREQLERKMQERGKAGSLVTLQVLEKYPEYVYSNVDIHGNPIDYPVKLTQKNDGENLFKHLIGFVAIVEKDYGGEIDWDMVYQEVLEFRENPDAWICPGAHYLVLSR